MLYYNPLCNYAAGIMHDQEKVEDIVQDVFLHFWHNKEQIDVNGNVKSYLFMSVKNKCFEIVRKQKSDVKMMHGLRVAESEFTLAEETDSWDDWVKIDQIYSSLRHLPPKCREVFEMAKIKGLTYNQISEILQISPKTVENHMGKAFMILRAKLLTKK